MKIKCILIFLSLSLNSLGQSNHKFSEEEVLKDLKFLSKSLKEAHYNVYAYTTKQVFDSIYLAVKSSIPKDSMSLLEATNIFQRLISAVNNGHTEIDFPGQSYGEYAYSGGTVFPLEIAFENNIPLVRKNFSGNDSIKIGSEVLSINGQSMSKILSEIYPQISAERIYFKNAKIELYSFPRYYWQVFGRQDTFDVEIKTDKGIKKYVLKAINLIEDYEAKRTEVLNAQMTLKFHGRTAYLNPGHFSGDEQGYRKFIDSSFVEISNRKSTSIIIDLRNNSGGDNSFSDYLVAYIANKPFKWNSKFTLKTSQFLKDHVRRNNDTTKTYFQEILGHKNGEIYEYEFDEYKPQTIQNRFTGKVFVLVNRQSHSQAALTAAQIQDHKFGVIVGEETGDYASLYASQFQYRLPNTGIQVKVSKGYIVRVNGSTEEQGVIPDILIKDYLLDENDEILEGVLRKIN
ncbi:S41 family peptidase [Mangrovimonas aestuarii]|uniref:S41 family peptidase n=1 Tax=Mangrovimonas aestuarii TaxID=3018443 RepID=UPI002378D980|nr:S41 family peptidase [Mangrovimonas aestuarii]